MRDKKNFILLKSFSALFLPFRWDKIAKREKFYWFVNFYLLPFVQEFNMLLRFLNKGKCSLLVFATQELYLDYNEKKIENIVKRRSIEKKIEISNMYEDFSLSLLKPLFCDLKCDNWIYFGSKFIQSFSLLYNIGFNSHR